MTIRETIAKIIADDNGTPDAKARIVLGYLYAIDFFSPGNGMLDDDPEMAGEYGEDESGLELAYEAARPYHGYPAI
jgi:hypothetical protein